MKMFDGSTERFSCQDRLPFSSMLVSQSKFFDSVSANFKNGYRTDGGRLGKINLKPPRLASDSG